MKFKDVNDLYNERKTASKTARIDTVINDTAVSDNTEEIFISKIVAFTNSEGEGQPFDIDEDKVEALKISIEDKGLLEPIIVRRLNNGQYQCLAGHHRLAACKAINFSTITARVVDCSDWTAFQIMVETNIHHEAPNYSDKAKIIKAYKKFSKSDKDKKKTNQMLARDYKISERQFYRIAKLNNFVSRIVECIDNALIGLNSVDDIDKLGEPQQEVLAEYAYQFEGKSLNVSKCKKAVDFLVAEPKLDVEGLIERMNAKPEKKKPYKNAVFNKACENLQLAAKMKEHSEEELTDLVVKFLAEHYDVEMEQEVEDEDDYI